jgi:hypothetical protein
MKTLIITLVFSMTAMLSNAKFYLPDIDDVQEVERRILLVELKEVSEDILWSLNTEAQKQTYQSFINEYNVKIQEIFSRYWIWTDQEVRFVPSSQLENITDRDLIKFAVFNSSKEIRTVEEQGTYKLTKFNLFYMARNGLIKTVFDMAFNTSEVVSSGEIGLAVKGFDLHLNAVKEGVDLYPDFIDITRNIQVLKSKVLFVDETFNSMDQGLIGQKYKNGFKVVKPVIISKILDDEKLIAAVTKITYNKKEKHFYCTVFDAANGRILSVLDFKGKQSKKESKSNTDAYANLSGSFSTVETPEKTIPPFKFLNKKLYKKITHRKAQLKVLK